MLSARLGSDKYKSLCHWFDSTRVQTNEARMPDLPKREMGALSTHPVIPSGLFYSDLGKITRGFEAIPALLIIPQAE